MELGLLRRGQLVPEAKSQRVLVGRLAVGADGRGPRGGRRSEPQHGLDIACSLGMVGEPREVGLAYRRVRERRESA